MKIAVLILSYRAPEALPLHAEYWADAGDVFAHVDGKVSSEKIPDVKNIHFVSRRRVFWGGWAMMEATMDLIRAAKGSGQYDRYLLVSDDSAPLLPRNELLSQLRDESKEFIWASEVSSRMVLDRYENFFWFDHPAMSTGNFHYLTRRIDDELLSAIRDLEALRRRGKKPVKLRHGDQWWALTTSAVDYICDIHSNDGWLRESFRFSSIPDEQYVQTILGRPWKEKFMYSERHPDLMPTQNVHKSIESLRSCVKPGYLFVRKVDPAVPELAELVRTGVIGVVHNV